MTISPYGLYTDRFVSLIYRHDFDKKLFRYAVAGTNLSFAHYACLQYDMIWGGLSHPEAQQGVAFEVPTSPLSEGGILLKDLLRVKYLNLYYLCVDFGCFQQLSTAVTGNAPRLVFGASLDL